MKKILQVYEMFTSYDGTTFVYALSYSLLLALAPLTALLVVFFRSSPVGLASILDFAKQYIPQDLLSPFIDFFLGNSPVELIPLIFFIVVSLWVASRAIYSFLMISAHLDEVELPQWFMRGVSLIDFVVLLASLGLMVFVLQQFPFTGLLTQTAVLFVGFCIFYRLLSFRNYQWRAVAPGALFTTVCMIASIIYLGFCVNQVFVEKDMVQPLKHYVTAVKILEKIFPFSLLK